jgi:hypothetical protein
VEFHQQTNKWHNLAIFLAYVAWGASFSFLNTTFHYFCYCRERGPVAVSDIRRIHNKKGILMLKIHLYEKVLF